MLTRGQFTEHLRYALDHLYDPDQLRLCKLNALFEVADQSDAPLALQKVLSKAIGALEPEETTPAQSRAWRLYELLVCRYLQQGSVQEVADQLGISHRHLRREQNAALEILAHHLWNQYNLNQTMPGSYRKLAENRVEKIPTVDEELSWLKNLPAGHVTNLNEVFPSVLALVQSLAARNQVALTTQAATTLPDSIVHPVVLRQLLLSLFDFAIARVPGGSLNVRADMRRQGIKVHIIGKSSASGLRAASHDESAGLGVVQKLASISRVALVFSTDANTFVAELTIPVLGQFPVLAIDDNTDTLALLQRYAKGTQYCLVEECDPNNAVRVAEQVSPLVIVLDVMMPETDGWEVLARLRQHPLMGDVPIIVCSILAIDRLAFSLGATACIRKPITQTAFLAVLDQQLGDLAIALR